MGRYFLCLSISNFFVLVCLLWTFILLLSSCYCVFVRLMVLASICLYFSCRLLFVHNSTLFHCKIFKVLKVLFLRIFFFLFYIFPTSVPSFKFYFNFLLFLFLKFIFGLMICFCHSQQEAGGRGCWNGSSRKRLYMRGDDRQPFSSPSGLLCSRPQDLLKSLPIVL